MILGDPIHVPMMAQEHAYSLAVDKLRNREVPVPGHHLVGFCTSQAAV